MSRIEENNKWRCNNCSEITLASGHLKAQSPFNHDDVLVACPKCKQCDEGFTLLCDEDGCTKEAGRGWPTGDDSDKWGGYRNTCGKHFQNWTMTTTPKRSS